MPKAWKQSLHRTLTGAAERWRGSPRDNLVFLHIPKSGGMSLHSAIARLYPLSNARLPSAKSWRAAEQLGRDSTDEVAELRLFLLAIHLNDGVRFVSGHFRFDERIYAAFHQRYRFVTLLRNPTRRWVSHYFYNRYKQHSQHRAISLELEHYLQTDAARRQGSIAVRYIGGTRADGDYNSEAAITCAKQNLEHFALVGCLEDLGRFVEVFQSRFHARLSIPQRNENPKDSAEIQSAITPDIERRIDALCEPDWGPVPARARADRRWELGVVERAWRAENRR